MRRLERIAHFLVTYLYYPAALIGSVLVSYAMLEAGWSAGLAVAANGTLFAVLCLGLEYAVPETPRWRLDAREAGADVLHGLLTNTIPTTLFRILFYSAIVAAAAHLSGILGGPIWPAGWPWPAQLLLALFVAETANYTIHRFLHESRFWPLHAVHHSSQRMYFLLVARKHPIQAFFTYGGRLSALWLVGTPPEMLVLYTAATGANGYVQHSNIRLRTGPLSWILATPELHRLHHSERAEESSRNYADVLIFWDLVLGTRVVPEDPERLYAGVGLGPDKPLRQTYWEHLKLPFVYNRLRAPEHAATERLPAASG